MANVVVSFDSFGRLLIPKSIRGLFSTSKFALQVEEEEIRLTPLKSWDEFFASAPDISVRELKRLRREEAELG